MYTNAVRRDINDTLATIRVLSERLKASTLEASHKIRLEILSYWKQWQSLPTPVRWGTYAAMLALLTLALLPIIGFTAEGVAAGSLAAAWHSSIGNVSAGSVFAMLQSAGATVTFEKAITAFAAAGAVGMGLGAANARVASKP